jgi:hypothetical protein
MRFPEVSKEQGEAVRDGEKQVQPLCTVFSCELSNQIADPDGGRGGVGVEVIIRRPGPGPRDRAM